MLVSYLVTFYNKSVYFPELVRSIEEQAGAFEKELVVADDCSDDAELEALVEFSRQYEKFPIHIVRSDKNTGPALCFNRGLDAARGAVTVAIDADDILRVGATVYYLDQLEASDADFVYARRRVKGHKKADDVTRVVVDDPLAYVLKNSIVHMCFAAKTDLLRAAGGADPRLFIQDQSLSVRMARCASRMVRSDWTTVYINGDEDGLSKNIAQQHHDRFWMVMNLWDDLPEAGAEVRAQIKDIARSALWKMRRDQGGVPVLSSDFWRYFIGRLTGIGPGVDGLKTAAGRVFAGAAIRKVT
ncbi:MAG: hypothetical protein DHS20C08_22450 [Rhodomicrobium sp.]|nr:MAG: hypothetical protein DHS20C08_22450 [Rhodomicrobium sp.]